MFTIAEKKKLTNDIFIFFEKILFKITKNNNTSGFIVAYEIHQVLGLMSAKTGFAPR